MHTPKGLDAVEFNRQFQNLRHANNFDFLRFCAAMAVIVTHAYPMTGRPENDLLNQLSGGSASFSTVGVKLFFVVSGYLITQSYEQSRSVLSYLWKRALRLFPGLLAMLLLLAVVVGPLVSTLAPAEYFADLRWLFFLGNGGLYSFRHDLPGVFQQNPLAHHVNGSLWTLQYEFTCYLVVLALGLLGRARARLGGQACAGPLAAGPAQGATDGSPPRGRIRAVVPPIAVLSLVALLASARAFVALFPWSSEPAAYLLPGTNLVPFHLLDFGLYFFVGALFYVYRARLRPRGDVALVIAVLWAASFVDVRAGRAMLYVALPYLTLYLAFLPSRLSGWGRFGDFSYGIYIYAFPVQQTLAHYTLGAPLSVSMMALGSAAATLGLAVLSWKLVESRALRFKSLV